MRYRDKANKLANEVAKMANGSLQSFALEGAVHRIEEALDKARRDAIEFCAIQCELNPQSNGINLAKWLTEIKDKEYD